MEEGCEIGGDCGADLFLGPWGPPGAPTLPTCCGIKSPSQISSHSLTGLCEARYVWNLVCDNEGGTGMCGGWVRMGKPEFVARFAGVGRSGERHGNEAEDMVVKKKRRGK